MVSPPKSADRKFLLKGETSFQSLLPDGSAVLVHRLDKGILKVDLRGDLSNENADPFFAQTSRVQIMDLSPKGTYLLTWERGSSDESENNMKVWNTSTGECVTGFRRKMINRSSWPYLQWTHDEKFAFLLTTNEVRVYPGAFPQQASTRFLDKIRVPGISQLSIPSSPASNSLGKFLFAAFIAKDKNKPSRAALYEYPPDSESPSPYPAIASKSLFQAEEMTVHWSPKGDAALIALQSTVDNTGQSYYGSSSLYLMSQQTTNDAIAVPLPQDGPVLDVAWMPNAEKPPCFAVAAGRMPSMASLHNGRDGKATFLFGNRHQNTVSWAPHGRFVNLAGFGNLVSESPQF
jgi:translation initiation factor 2A